MKIEIHKFNKNWTLQFDEIKVELKKALHFLEPQIDHIGSTSFEGLSAKPIIDILIGLKNENQLDEAIIPLLEKELIYFEIYNSIMPYRRFFVKTLNNDSQKLIIKNENETNSSFLNHSNRNAHIHIIPIDSIHWLRHIAFKHYLIENPKIKDEYQTLKEKLSTKIWKDGNEYNSAKNDFIKYHEEIAINWYKNKKHQSELSNNI